MFTSILILFWFVRCSNNTTTLPVRCSKWKPGVICRCKSLKLQKGAEHLYLNERIRIMSGSLCKVIEAHDTSINGRGQIKIEWLGDENCRLAVPSKYLQRVSNFTLHHIELSDLQFYAKLLWNKLSVNPKNRIMVFPYPHTSFMHMDLSSKAPNLAMHAQHNIFLSLGGALDLFESMQKYLSDHDTMTDFTKYILTTTPPHVLYTVIEKMLSINGVTERYKQVLRSMREAFGNYRRLCARGLYHIKHVPRFEEMSVLTRQCFGIRVKHIMKDILLPLQLKNKQIKVTNKRFWVLLMAEIKKATHTRYLSKYKDKHSEIEMVLMELMEVWLRCNDEDNIDPPNVHMIWMHTHNARPFDICKMKNFCRHVHHRDAWLLPQILDSITICLSHSDEYEFFAEPDRTWFGSWVSLGKTCCCLPKYCFCATRCLFGADMSDTGVFRDMFAIGAAVPFVIFLPFVFGKRVALTYACMWLGMIVYLNRVQ